jgi:hypothetical protein
MKRLQTRHFSLRSGLIITIFFFFFLSQHTKCSLARVFYKRIIQIKVLRPLSKRKLQGKHTKIYDLHNLAPSPSKDL